MLTDRFGIADNALGFNNPGKEGRVNVWLHLWYPVAFFCMFVILFVRDIAMRGYLPALRTDLFMLLLSVWLLASALLEAFPGEGSLHQFIHNLRWASGILFVAAVLCMHFALSIWRKPPLGQCVPPEF